MLARWYLLLGQFSVMDNDLDRSLAKTGLSEMETPRDSIKCKIATIGKASSIEIGKPVAMADVAEPVGRPEPEPVARS